MASTLEAAVQDVRTSLSRVNGFYEERNILFDCGVLNERSYNRALEHEKNLNYVVKSTLASYLGEEAPEQVDDFVRESPLQLTSWDIFKPFYVGAGANIGTKALGLGLALVHPLLGYCVFLSSTAVGIGTGVYTAVREVKKERKQLLEGDKTALVDNTLAVDIDSCVNGLLSITEEAQNTPIETDYLDAANIGALYKIQQADLPLYKADLKNIQENMSEVMLRSKSLLPSMLGKQVLLE